MKTMNVPSREDDGASPVQTPVKKLRQALLPFQCVSPVGMSSVPDLSSKKRKLADDSNNGKNLKNIRLETQNETSVDSTETKENIVIKVQKNEILNVSQSNDEMKCEQTENSPEEEESLCLQLDEETDLPEVKEVTIIDFKTDQQKEVTIKSSPSKEKSHDTEASEGREVIPKVAGVEAEMTEGSLPDLELLDEKVTVEAEESVDKSNHGDSEAKSSVSESEEGRSFLSSTDISTPTHLPSESKSPTVVLKKKILSAQKMEQRAKIKEEMHRKKEERRKEKELLREEKLAQKKREILEKKKIQQERLSLKLEEKQKKEEEKNKKRKQKEEERLKREEERQKKEEEKQKREEKKEEERQKKEEEKLKKEEEKLRREEERKKEEEEEQKKKEKAAAAFASFFVPKKTTQSKNAEEQKAVERKFMPFMVKGDMRLAPIVRGNLNEKDKEEIDVKLSEQSVRNLYLEELKKKMRCPKTYSATWPLSELKDEVVIIDEEDAVPPGGDGGGLILDTHQDLHLRAKLLQFCENRRPPYWGTWRKKSRKIRPKCPFHKDEKFFDYEVDSDDEWEEEEPGESLHGSDDEKESEDEYEVDNEFFVPHGYLSNEEADGEEEDGNTVSPEMQKAKLKLLGIEFEEEMKQQTKQIKPQLLGFYWSFEKTVDENLNHHYEKIFMPYKAVVCCEAIPTSFTSVQNSSAVGTLSGGQIDGVSVGRKKTVFPEAAVPDLINLVHGNTNACKFLVMEFITYWKKKNDPEDVAKENEGESPASSKSVISKLCTARKIKELASWMQFPEGSVMTGKYAWFVPEETRVQFGLTDLCVPNSWKYNLKPPRKSETKPSTSPSVSASEVAVESPVSGSAKPHLITKFTKVMSKEERLKQLQQARKSAGDSAGPQCRSNVPPKKVSKVDVVPGTSSPLISAAKTNHSVSNCPDSKVRKRVPLLVSVPCGQEIPKSYSLATFLKQSDSVKDTSSSFKKADQNKANVSSKITSRGAAESDDNCIVLD